MNRYIDADALYEYITNQVGGVDCSILFDEEIAPSINICFCKDCKHLHEEGVTSDKDYYCERCHDTYGYWREVKLDGFCSYGEREGERC